MGMSPTCKKCGQPMTLDNMQALPDGGGFICKSCPGKDNSSPVPKFLNKYKQFSEEHHPAKLGLDVEPIDTSDSFFTDKVYRCSHCRYKFKKKADANVRVCPNCGRDELEQEFESYTEQLLNE